jgi:N-acylneuraminate cytidylyltransferase
MKNIAIIIPALDNNRFSEKGDLIEFGSMTLLEWKINQLKALDNIANIYITTPSAKIAADFKNKGVNILKRKSSNFSDVIKETAQKVKEETIMWTSCNAPFISGITYSNALNEYAKLDFSKFDSLVSVYRMNEYFFYNNNALNFDITIHQGRQEINPAFKVTNGIFIANREIPIKHKKHLGIHPFLFNIDKLSSYEITDIEDHSMATEIIASYFLREMKLSSK